jgi:hypothetical protein
MTDDHRPLCGRGTGPFPRLIRAPTSGHNNHTACNVRSNKLVPADVAHNSNQCAVGALAPTAPYRRLHHDRRQPTASFRSERRRNTGELASLTHSLYILNPHHDATSNATATTTAATCGDHPGAIRAQAAKADAVMQPQPMQRSRGNRCRSQSTTQLTHTTICTQMQHQQGKPCDNTKRGIAT